MAGGIGPKQAAMDVNSNRPSGKEKEPGVKILQAPRVLQWNATARARIFSAAHPPHPRLAARAFQPSSP
jgi:hypothetical protein